MTRTDGQIIDVGHYTASEDREIERVNGVVIITT